MPLPMISKIWMGRSFKKAIEYVGREDAQPTIIAFEGVRAHDPVLTVSDFNFQQSLQQNKKKACFHGVLSFSPGEVVPTEIQSQIAIEYLRCLGIKNTQFFVMRHANKKHVHLHLIANLVDSSGKSVNESWIGLNGKRVAQKLTDKYSLKVCPRKMATGRKILPEVKSRTVKMDLRKRIFQALAKVDSLSALIKTLEKNKISVVLRIRKADAMTIGISFKKGKSKISGSKVHPSFSLPSLKEYFRYTDR